MEQLEDEVRATATLVWASAPDRACGLHHGRALATEPTRGGRRAREQSPGDPGAVQCRLAVSGSAPRALVSEL